MSGRSLRMAKRLKVDLESEMNFRNTWLSCSQKIETLDKPYDTACGVASYAIRQTKSPP